MSGRFIPDSDSAFADMAHAFATPIAKDPQRYTLSDLDAELLTRKVNAFRDALAVAQRRTTRTPQAICAKDERRREAEGNVQAPRRDHPRQRPDQRGRQGRRRRAGAVEGAHEADVPDLPPRLRYGGAVGEGGTNSARHVLHVAPGFDFQGRADREGAVRMELFVDLVAPGEPVPSFPGEFPGGRPWYLRSFTKTPIRVAPPLPPTPMLVVYWVRWADSTGEVGPFSPTCQARWEGANRGTLPTLGAVPDVRQLERDPRQITVVTQLRERHLEGARARRMLEDARARTGATKQLPAPDEADADDAPSQAA